MEIQSHLTSFIDSIHMNRCANVIICIKITLLKKVMLLARNRCIVSVLKKHVVCEVPTLGSAAELHGCGAVAGSFGCLHLSLFF